MPFIKCFCRKGYTIMMGRTVQMVMAIRRETGSAAEALPWKEEQLIVHEASFSFVLISSRIASRVFDPFSRD